ncbi:ATP-dependent sacrificial sulfur transferase LarE [Actinocrispum wychmicini]|uniref:Asparagine synthetase domain-containing protein n=1 Tax=Actinocrispum wychmicini TaxID=1213861 RepID=A0A4R2JQ28_9PSEU|nr:ATP-dependent sacrificial sulfur transferase LarE [Actinocrispum wychmicini]TCO61117.1 uncharacterized protein EV192_103701 [Actinocrispum wychmicini]
MTSDAVFVDRVMAALRPYQRVGVALSGGVDSSVLLALAARALGPENVVAITGVSASVPASERTAAREVASHVGVALLELETHEAARADYVRNGPDRCFHCRDELFSRISDEVLERERLDAVAYGENADDSRRLDRPGARAAMAHGVLRPLAEAGMDKAAVRRVARVLALPTADRPASPCLASRIPHFEPVLPQKLRQIEAAESALHALGFADCRVRHHGDVARVELPIEDLPHALNAARLAMLQAVRDAGFRFVTVDLAGMQSGAFTLPFVTR